jgi:hypothetical protein
MQNGDETATIFIQMSEVAGALSKTISGVKVVLDENDEAASALLNKYNEEYLGNEYEAIQKQEVKTLSNAFRELNYLNREVLQVLNTKMNYYQFPSKLKESIESVRHNKHFEGEITHIIRCLDEISDKMKSGDTLLVEEDRGRIDSLHTHYITDSEHRIHDYVFSDKNKATSELFKETIHSAQNEDGDSRVIFE